MNDNDPVTFKSVGTMWEKNQISTWQFLCLSAMFVSIWFRQNILKYICKYKGHKPKTIQAYDTKKFCVICTRCLRKIDEQ